MLIFDQGHPGAEGSDRACAGRRGGAFRVEGIPRDHNARHCGGGLGKVTPRFLEKRCGELQRARHPTRIEFLNAPGRHVQEDLPRMVAEAASSHAGVDFVLAAPLGAHEGVIDAALDRVREAIESKR